MNTINFDLKIFSTPSVYKFPLKTHKNLPTIQPPGCHIWGESLQSVSYNLEGDIPTRTDEPVEPLDDSNRFRPNNPPPSPTVLKLSDAGLTATRKIVFNRL